MPEGRCKIHPFLVTILTDRAREKRVDSRIGLVQKGNDVILKGRFVFRIKAVLAI